MAKVCPFVSNIHAHQQKRQTNFLAVSNQFKRALIRRLSIRDFSNLNLNFPNRALFFIEKIQMTIGIWNFVQTIKMWNYDFVVE